MIRASGVIIGARIYRGAAWGVLFGIADVANEDGVGYPSYAYIESVGRVERRSIQRGIETLEADGAIRCIERNKGRGRPNRYQIDLARFERAEQAAVTARRRAFQDGRSGEEAEQEAKAAAHRAFFPARAERAEAAFEAAKREALDAGKTESVARAAAFKALLKAFARAEKEDSMSTFSGQNEDSESTFSGEENQTQSPSFGENKDNSAENKDSESKPAWTQSPPTHDYPKSETSRGDAHARAEARAARAREAAGRGDLEQAVFACAERAGEHWLGFLGDFEARLEDAGNGMMLLLQVGASDFHAEKLDSDLGPALRDAAGADFIRIQAKGEAA